MSRRAGHGLFALALVLFALAAARDGFDRWVDATPMPSLVAETEIISGQGAVQGVRFEASEEMAQYICIVHPNTMVGDVSVSGGGGGASNNSSGQ